MQLQIVRMYVFEMDLATSNNLKCDLYVMRAFCSHMHIIQLRRQNISRLGLSQFNALLLTISLCAQYIAMDSLIENNGTFSNSCTSSNNSKTFAGCWKALLRQQVLSHKLLQLPYGIRVRKPLPSQPV